MHAMIRLGPVCPLAMKTDPEIRRRAVRLFAFGCDGFNLAILFSSMRATQFFGVRG